MKDGIVIINKDKNMTSRDVVNKACKILNTKHIGHTGTLDPIATGVLVLGVNDGCKIIELLSSSDKVYEAKVIVGIETDTLDITGIVLKEYNIENLTIDSIKNAINYYKGTYMQEVPKYSAVHVNGKRLHEYARNNIEVTLPKRSVTIYDIELKSFEKENNYYTFTILTHVSKGTYIRSLIRDIGIKLGYPCTMMELTRLKQGNFSIDDSVSIDNLSYDNLLKIEDSLNLNKIVVNDIIKKKVLNGSILELDTKDDLVLIMDKDNNLLALYTRYSKDITKMKPYRVFGGK